MERAGDRLALDRALGQVATHVAAVGVEDADRATLAGKDDEFGAECLDLVRFAVAEVVHQAEAVPAARVALGQRTDVDGAHLFRYR